VRVTESQVTIETAPRGILAAAAHDLRIDAPIASGESEDGVRCTARFAVAAMRVASSRRHGTDAWQAPTERDARDIEERIRDQAFAGVKEIVVEARLEGDRRATITTRAARSQTVTVTADVERDGGKARVRGRCELSLAALGTGKIHVPLGAIKLDDRVVVTFDVRFA
jgi:hypothetical protein